MQEAGDSSTGKEDADLLKLGSFEVVSQLTFKLLPEPIRR